MTTMVIAIALLGGLGLFFLGHAILRLSRRRPMAAGRAGMGAGICLALAGLAIALAFNLYTYRRLSYEQPVAHLRFEALGPQYYRAIVTPVHGQKRVFDLHGDQWQLDAEVLKFRPLANLLGFDALYRLDRISGRYDTLAGQRDHKPSVYALHPPDRGLSVWWIAQRLPHWADLVDAEYGSATYLPMADNAEYNVTLSQSGLVARPADEAARSAAR